MNESAPLDTDPRAKHVPESWRDPLRSFEMHLRVLGAPDTTIYTRLSHARMVARAMMVPPDEVTPAAMLEWLAGKRWALETRRAMHATIRDMWACWLSSGVVSVDVASALPHVKRPQHKPRPVSELALADGIQHADARTSLILRLASECGLRRGEIAVIAAGDLVPDLAGTSLVVHGKGSKTRVIPVTDEMAHLIEQACLIGCGWAFPGQIDGHLSPHWVGTLASRALQTATLHQGRHRFATQVLRRTGNLMAVKELLGHESLSTTQVYLEVDAAELRAAVESLAA